MAGTPPYGDDPGPRCRRHETPRDALQKFCVPIWTHRLRTMDPVPLSSPRVRVQKIQSRFEQILERGIWNSRLIVILAVLFGILSAFVLFIVGSIEIVTTLRHSLSITDESVRHEEILVGIIGAVDFYLIGIVLLIFSFGVYELFISKIIIARDEGEFNNYP